MQTPNRRNFEILLTVTLIHSSTVTRVKLPSNFLSLGEREKTEGIIQEKEIKWSRWQRHNRDYFCKQKLEKPRCDGNHQVDL